MKYRTLQLTVSLLAGPALTLGLVLLVGQSMPVRADPHVLYVAPGGDCNGASPCYASVQAAVDAGDSSDEIRVAAGSYTGVSAREDVTQVAYISQTVTIRGGYTTDNWTVSDPDANPTTLDAEGGGRVLYITGDISPTIEGLRITGGDAAGLGGGYFGFDCGGGVYLCYANSATTLNNNQVFRNTAYIGGGVCVHHGAAKLSDNTISSNTASDGGGLWLNSDTAAFSGNTIVSNIANQTGRGLFALSSSAVFTANTIMSNTSSNMGGGLFFQGGDGTLSGNVIRGNADSGTGYPWNGGGG